MVSGHQGSPSKFEHGDFKELWTGGNDCSNLRAKLKFAALIKAARADTLPC